MWIWVERLSSVAFAAAAILIAVLYAIRGGDRPPAATFDPGDPTYIRGWEELVERGVVDGGADAPATLIQFVDFE
jgi:hypothetical protein